MADTTAISITAIVSSAIIGPAVMAWAARKQDRGRFTHEREMGDERFTHERVMRDTGDLRSLLYEGAECLEAIQTSMANLRHAFQYEGTERSDPFREVLIALYKNLREFRRKTAQIAISAGPDTDLSRTCKAASDHVLEVTDRVQSCLSMKRAEADDVKVILDEGKVLDGHRDAYIEAAHEAGGFQLPASPYTYSRAG